MSVPGVVPDSEETAERLNAASSSTLDFVADHLHKLVVPHLNLALSTHVFGWSLVTERDLTLLLRVGAASTGSCTHLRLSFEEAALSQLRCRMFWSLGSQRTLDLLFARKCRFSGSIEVLASLFKLVLWKSVSSFSVFDLHECIENNFYLQVPFDRPDPKLSSSFPGSICHHRCCN